MIGYVDEFVLPVQKKNLGKYCRIAKGAWKDRQKMPHWNILSVWGA
jgi:hypothetical protein